MSAHINFQGTSGYYNLMSTEMLSRVLGTLGCSHRPMEFLCGNDLDMPRDRSTCPAQYIGHIWYFYWKFDLTMVISP